MPRSVVDGGVRSARRNSRVSAAAMAVCRDTITLSAPDLHPGRQVVRIMGYSETSRKETCRDISGLQFSEDDVNRIVLSVFVDLRPLVRSWPKQTNRTWQLPTINTWIAASSGDNRGMQATTSKVWLLLVVREVSGEHLRKLLWKLAIESLRQPAIHSSSVPLSASTATGCEPSRWT